MDKGCVEETTIASCQCEKELGVKLRNAEASIDAEMEIKIFMPFILPYFALFMTSVHSHFTYMYSQMCVYILHIYVCIYVCMIVG